MKAKLLTTALAGLGILLVSTLSIAAPHDHKRGYGHAYGHPPKPHYNYRDYSPQANYGPPRHRANQAAAYHRWQVGQRLPQAYRGRAYYVNDWRAYRLSAPPRGHRWVNVNGDYILVAVASSIITQVLFGR